MKRHIKNDGIIFAIIPVVGIISVTVFSIISILVYNDRYICAGFIIGLIALALDGILMLLYIKKGKY